MERSAPSGMSRTRTSSRVRRSEGRSEATRELAWLLRRPRNLARVTGTEALFGDAQCGVHPGPHVLDADLIGQLHRARVSETPPQIGDLLVGDGERVGGHRVGIGDRCALVVGEQWTSRVI